MGIGITRDEFDELIEEYEAELEARDEDFDRVVQRQRCEINTLYNKIEGKDATIARLEQLLDDATCYIRDHISYWNDDDPGFGVGTELRKHMEQEAPREQ